MKSTHTTTIERTAGGRGRFDESRGVRVFFCLDVAVAPQAAPRFVVFDTAFFFFEGGLALDFADDFVGGFFC